MLSVPAAGRQGDDGQGDGGGGDRERVTIVCSNSPNTLPTLVVEEEGSSLHPGPISVP